MAKTAEKAAWDVSKGLWPVPIPVIGGSGLHASGKTLFGISICPGPGTVVIDFENSSEPYKSIGFERIDVPSELIKKHPNGYSQLDVFNWFRDYIRAMKGEKKKVLVVDPITDIEAGMVMWVRANPQVFGYNHNQFSKMEGIMWDCVKQFMKLVLSEVAAKVETFYFVAHSKKEWIGSTPTSKDVPKGKATLMELASLYLWFERKPGPDGKVEGPPSANVLKHRLVKHEMIDGELKFVPLIPPRLPVATPGAIRQYMLAPKDPAKYKAEELVVPQPVTESELLAMRTNIAQTELQTEQIRIDRETLLMNAGAAQRAAAANLQKNAEGEVREELHQTAAVTPQVPLGENAQAIQNGLKPSLQFTELDTVASLHSTVERFKNRLAFTDEQWAKVMERRGVMTIPELDKTKAFDLCVALAGRIEDEDAAKK